MIEDSKILKFLNCNQDEILKILDPQIFCCFEFEEAVIEFIPTEFFRFKKYRKYIFEIAILKKMCLIYIRDLSNALLILDLSNALLILHLCIEFNAKLIRCHDWNDEK